MPGWSSRFGCFPELSRPIERSSSLARLTLERVLDAPTPDVIVVGAGAAGLATAIFARRLGHASVRLVDGAARPGAKILV
ncbi:MAG: NAD(P)/FAD-dependent oxidoreductase, partial [Acidobacteria bacterium]|nr:NAD(P)/FAD-dependent oxidoreductase [Acidobacteriota bacterium]